MRIAFDATAMPARRAGAGVYIYHLARALAEHADRHPLLLTVRGMDFDDLSSEAGVTLHHVRAAGRARRFAWEQGALPLVARRWRADLLHGPHHALPLLTAAPRAVTTIHDITFDLLPHRYTRARRTYMRVITRLGLLRADRVIVPSTFVRDALVRRYRVPSSRLRVVAEAAPSGMKRVTDQAILTEVRARYTLPDRFLLSVGTREPGKNREMLVSALRTLARRGERIPLVVVGQRGWLQDEHAPHAEGIAYTSYVPDAHLAALYTLASAVVFPSWLEGFGLPPLEAMACGTPVISSNRPAMPEVLSDAALYANPHDADAWADAIERVLTDRTLAESLTTRGLAQAARYSWQRAARETLAVYTEAMEPNPPTPFPAREGGAL